MPVSVLPALQTTEQTLSVRVIHSFADAESMRSAWDDLVRNSGADIYQTFDWCRLWWNYYGHRRQLQLLLCYTGEQLVGIVPAFVETLWLGPARLRVAKLVGSDFSIQLCNLPVLSTALPQVVSWALHYFLGKHRCDLMLLGPVSGPTARFDELLAIGEAKSDLVAETEILGSDCNTYILLPDSFDQYLLALSKKARGNFNRSSGQLAKARRVTVDVVSQTNLVGAEFEAFCRLHAAQWQPAGKLGHFGDWPHAREFNRDIVRRFAEKGTVRFYRIVADDQVVSSQYTLTWGRISYWRLPARLCGPEWDQYGLGAMGLVRKIEAVIGEGVKAVEAGRGHYAYKLQYGGTEYPSRTVQYTRRGFGVLTRVRSFRTFAAVLDLVYYKVLFARLAPRLPIFRRPLWPVWIRSTW